MDLPPYHHHHHRYVQRPPNFSHKPNFFHHLPPPPQPPPPPPFPNLPSPPPHHHISQRPLPPPQSPPFHHHSQFSFTPRPPENPQFFDCRSSPRVSSNLTLDQPPYPSYPLNIPFNDRYHNPSSPPPPPRFILDDYFENRTCSANNNQEPLWGRRDVEFDVDDDDQRYRLERHRMDTDVLPSRDFRSSAGNYEGERWRFGTVDDVSVGSSSRRMALDHGYDYGFSNRLRVDKEEIHRSPQKKQVQKKSVLLRIQCGKANNRSRNQDNDLNSGVGLRGKQKDVFERLERRAEGRQGSPVELNVSFRSNALVAKAIMTPSSPVVDSDISETRRSKKTRKLNLSGSPMTEVGDNLGKGESSANDSGHRSSSKKEPKCSNIVAVSAGGSSSNSILNSKMDTKHLLDKITDSGGGCASDGTLNSNESKLLPDKVTVSIVRSASNSLVQSSIGTNDLTGTGESKRSPEIMVSDQGSSLVRKDGRPLRKIRKKKKVTALNRVGVDSSNAIGTPKKSISVRQQDEDVVQLVERTTSDTHEDVNMKLPLDELVSEVEKPSKVTVFSEDIIEQSNSEWKKATTAEVLVSSSHLGSEVTNFADETCKSVRCPSMLNSTCMLGVQNIPTSVSADNVGGHSQDELRVSGDGLTKESSEAMVCVEGNCDAALSIPDGSKIPISFVADNIAGHSQDELRVSGDGLIKESSETMVCIEGNCDAVLLSLDGSKILTSYVADDVERNSLDELRVAEDGLFKESSEAMVSEAMVCVEGNGEGLSSLEWSKIPTSSAVDNVGGHPQDELRASEDSLIRESSEGNIVLSSLEGSKILEGEVSSVTTDTHISSVSDFGFSDGKENAAAVVGSSKAGYREPSSDPKIVPLLTHNEKRLPESFLDGSDGNDSGSNSSECGRIVVVKDLLRAEYLSNCGPGAGTFGDGRMKRSCIDWVTVSPETNHTKASVSSVVSAVDDITITVDDECLPKFTRERKSRDAQSAFTTTKMSETEENMFSSFLVQGKNFSYLREHLSREEEVTILGDGNDTPKGNCSHEGPSEVGISRQDFSRDGSSSCSAKMPKKRKVSSPRRVKSVSCVTTHEGPSSMSVTVPLINDVSVTELGSQNTVSNADDGPPSHPSVTLDESSTAKDVCQAVPFNDDLMDHFSDVQQVIACNSHLGAAGKETAPSGLSVGMSRMACGVSEDKGGSLGINKKLALEDPKCHNYVLGKEDVPLLANSPSLFAGSISSSAMKASVKVVESVPNVTPLVPSPEELPNNSVSEQPTKSSISNEIVIEKDPNVAESSIIANAPISCPLKISSNTSEFARCLDHGIPQVNVSTVALWSQDTVKSTGNVSSVSWKPNFSANHQSPAAPRVFCGRPSPSFVTSRNMPVSKKPLTWCRTSNSSSSVIGRQLPKNCPPSQSNLSKDLGKVSTYIRKGNSLVRKPPPVGSLSQAYRAPSSSVYRLNSSGVNDLKRKPENRTDSPSFKGTLEVNAPSERPKTPPLSAPFGCLTKSTSLPVVDHPGNGSIATNSELLEVTDSILSLKPSEHALTSSALPQCQNGLSDNSENQNALDEGTSGKKLIYVKKRSNQLVATSDKTKTSSGGYYKRRKNQLIRASSTNHMKQRVGAVQNIVPIRRGLARTPKWSKFSLVWKLGDVQSSRKGGSTVGYEKLWPYLFPWKRASYRRSFLSSSPVDNPASIIRRKLLAKKRETIYTRSIHGLSLRRSKVLSVPGSSLKWSISNEQRSKTAIEEAARAVAVVDKKKRGRDGSYADSLNGNNVSRERIFRIGCERYKMDPSGKTLQRISDKEPSVSIVPEAKKSYIPQRLLIGNNEYVRVGNGNKLVRNPKRRVRILASEKVRWSLHTARIRLARKKQYCQFFTRFGKCNKDNGKCPYIHDPSKIAVCTKFLNGSCTDTSCKLTHEVIPERMQDCSYFLQGICSNENCPYRHVNVNPSASICEGFLRGYCADGNECRKKHTYVCPVFEATGSCPEGSKCKLHHPKNKRKGVKRKASGEMKNVQSRYFGSPHIDISERITAGLEKPSVNGNGDIFFSEGKFVDFISLDGSDEEGQTIDHRSEETPICKSGSAEMRPDDIDELIKPMSLLNRIRSVNSSPFVGSPSDRTASYVSEDSLF